MAQEVSTGLIVTHPGKPEWGPGRVLDIQGTHIIVYFRDLPGDHPEDAVKKFDSRSAILEPATTQPDPFLDNLPPYRDGRFVQPPRKRVTLDEGIAKFHSLFPLYFEDPAYIGIARNTPTASTGERAYKWAAHELFADTLGGGRLRAQLDDGAIEQVRQRALAVEGRTNLLAVFEKAALRDGLREDRAANQYFLALDQVLSAPDVEPGLFGRYLHAVESLPSGGNTSPAKWTVATILPYLAQPDRFMFLKPQVTQDCAARLTFDLCYTTELK